MVVNFGSKQTIANIWPLKPASNNYPEGNLKTSVESSCVAVNFLRKVFPHNYLQKQEWIRMKQLHRLENSNLRHQAKRRIVSLNLASKHVAHPVWTTNSYYQQEENGWPQKVEKKIQWRPNDYFPHPRFDVKLTFHLLIFKN